MKTNLKRFTLGIFFVISLLSRHLTLSSFLYVLLIMHIWKKSTVLGPLIVISTLCLGLFILSIHVFKMQMLQLLCIFFFFLRLEIMKRLQFSLIALLPLITWALYSQSKPFLYFVLRLLTKTTLWHKLREKLSKPSWLHFFFFSRLTQPKEPPSLWTMANCPTESSPWI